MGAVRYIDSPEAMVPGHETILHTLNKWKQYGGKPWYYGVENFVGTEPVWNKVPLIFAQEHPDLDLVRDNLSKALSSVKDFEGKPGSICGHMENTRVEMQGQPRLATKTMFENQKVQKLYDDGKLTLSTAFYNLDGNKDGRMAGKIQPNHVLVFVQDQQNQGVDQGAMFLNKQEDPNVSQFKHNLTEFNGVLNSVKELYRDIVGGAPPELINKPDDEAVKNAEYPWDQCIEDMKAEGNDDESASAICASIKNRTVQHAMEYGLADNVKDARALVAQKFKEDKLFAYQAGKIRDMFRANKALKGEPMGDKDKDPIVNKDMVAKDKEISTLKEQVAALTNKVNEHEKAQKDADWAQIKMKLPPGLVHKDEDEAKAREMFETNPMAFMNKVLDHKPQDPKKKDGDQFKNKGEDDKKANATKTVRELRMATGRMPRGAILKEDDE